MITASTWLSYAGFHNTSVAGLKDWRQVRAAAQKLDRNVWDDHRIKLMVCFDAWRFRDMSSKEVERAQRAAMSLGYADFPQLGKHADPTCRHLTPDNFYALVGTVTDRPLPLYTLNTAALYDASWAGDVVKNLFVSRRLWSDDPDRDCAGLTVEVEYQHAYMLSRLPAIHLGTAWVREDRRGQGIGDAVSRLHRLIAWLRFGSIPQFATIVPGRNHDKLFRSQEIGTVYEKRDGLTVESRVLFYSSADIVADAGEVLNGAAV